MTLAQILLLALLAALLALFAAGRWRMEIVALGGLAAAGAAGLVPAERLFSGFASPAVLTVVEVLLIVRALSRARPVEALAGILKRRLRTRRRALAGLTGLAAGLSMVMNNVGALALTLPVARAVARRAGLTPRALTIPLAYATLLGGLCTLIGTPANLMVSAALADATGAGFAFLAFAPAGLAATAAGLAVILLWTPRALGGDEAADGGESRRVVLEAVAPPGSPLLGQPVSALGVEALSLWRDGARLAPLWPRTPLEPGDVLLLAGPAEALDAAFAAGRLAPPPGGAAGRTEAVVMPGSTVVGSPVGALEFLAAHGARVGAVAPGQEGRRFEGRLADLRLAMGDVLRIDGPASPGLRGALRERDLAVLAPEAEDDAAAGPVWPATVFGLGVLAAAFGLASPPAAFGAVVLALAAGGALDLRAGLAALDWPVILMLAAMIPLGEAAAQGGAAAGTGAALAALAPGAGPSLAVAAALVAALVVTPFVNNAAAAAALAPVAVAAAPAAGAPPEALLLAVAAGASIDFLTPFGHHNNTLALGLGGYRFADFLRAGWPVTLAAASAAWAAICAVWL
jgi:di/tricarboxylate transporter